MTAAYRARSHARAFSRFAFVGAASATGVLLLAVPALAHVTVTPDSAQGGSAAVLTFHIPNEEATADTTQVDLQIPTDHPIAQLLVQPVPGWTVAVHTITLAKPLVTDDGQFSQAVSEVIWSGGKIAPGQFQSFTVSADPLPEGVGSLAFKAIQTYSNGDVVRWIDVPQAGQAEPDHPAAVLTLTGGTGAGGVAGTGAAAGAGGAASSNAEAASSSSAASSSGSDTLALGLAGGALACGLGALALGWLNRRRRAEPVSAPPAAAAPAPAKAPAARSRDRARR